MQLPENSQEHEDVKPKVENGRGRNDEGGGGGGCAQGKWAAVHP